MNWPFLTNQLFLHNLRVYLLVFILAGLSWWLVEIFRFDYQVDKEVEAAKHSADYFSKGYLRKDLNEQGLLKSELSAESMLHYSDDGMTHIDKPHLILYNADRQIPPWVVKSDFGILSADGKNLLLKGNVFIDRAQAQGVRQIKIITSNLRVQPKISYAESDDRAELISPPNHTEGTGIQITFKKPIYIKLLSKVKSRYVLN
jgi:lipopolysaccharide export system protein LptC